MHFAIDKTTVHITNINCDINWSILIHGISPQEDGEDFIGPWDQGQTERGVCGGVGVGEWGEGGLGVTPSIFYKFVGILTKYQQICENFQTQCCG